MDSTPESRAKSIFGDLLDVPPDQREALLDRACAGDPALRARVTALLAAASRTGDFLASTQTPALTALDDAPGTMIGPYRLTGLLGEGGFGAVHRAEQTAPVRREVAVKILKPGMDTRGVVARFEQERQALALMDHPHIARVFDAGATPAGRPYFVMELVRGEPITEYCDRRRLGVRDRLELLRQVCAAVQHAHTKGLIHRDLKPANVLVEERDGAGVVKVIDFGIAKALGGALTDKTVFTRERQLIGTPEYMSPEQAGGSPDIDTRTDVYSLGVVLYELLAGLPPFDPERLRSAAFAEMQRIIVQDDPPAPSTRLSRSGDELGVIAQRRGTEPARLSAMVRGELDWIVMRALDKDRARRYESPGALADDLARHLRGEPVRAAPPSRTYLLRKFVRRHRGPVIAAGLVVGALALGVVGTTIGLLRARDARDESRLQERRARDEAARADREAADARLNVKIADSVNDLMNAMIQRADRAREGGRADVTVREVMDAAADELVSHPEQYEPNVRMKLAKTVGETYRELGLLEQAERVLRVYMESQLELHGAGSIEHAGALNDIASLLKARGRLDEAWALYERSRAVLESAGEPGEEAFVAMLNNMAAIRMAKDDPAGSEVDLRRALDIQDRRGWTTTPVYATTLHNLAVCALQAGRADEAEALYERVMTVRGVRDGDTSPEALGALNALASIRYRRGKFVEALAGFEKQVAGLRRLYGDDHPELVNPLESVGLAAGRVGQTDRAVAAIREASALADRRLGRGHPRARGVAQSLVTVLFESGRDAEARLAAADATARNDADPAPPDSDALLVRHRLALLTLNAGDAANAEAVWREGLARAAARPKDWRYRWLLDAMHAGVGAALAQRARAAEGEQAALLDEAERLVFPACESLLASTTIQTRGRAFTGVAALDHAVEVAQTALALAPSPERAERLAHWKKRRDEYAAANPIPSVVPPAPAPAPPPR